MSIDKDLLDQLMKGRGRSPGDLFVRDGVPAELTKALDEHLTGERAGPPLDDQNQPPNRRNGTSPGTVTTDSGKVIPGIPRDRNGSFAIRVNIRSDVALGNKAVFVAHPYRRHAGCAGTVVRGE